MTNEDITGRDNDVWLKALSYAIVTIELLPVERREKDYHDDMCKLLWVHVPDQSQREELLKGAMACITGISHASVKV